MYLCSCWEWSDLKSPWLSHPELQLSSSLDPPSPGRERRPRESMDDQTFQLNPEFWTLSREATGTFFCRYSLRYDLALESLYSLESSNNDDEQQGKCGGLEALNKGLFAICEEVNRCVGGRNCQDCAKWIKRSTIKLDLNQLWRDSEKRKTILSMKVSSIMKNTVVATTPTNFSSMCTNVQGILAVSQVNFPLKNVPVQSNNTLQPISLWLAGVWANPELRWSSPVAPTFQLLPERTQGWERKHRK